MATITDNDLALFRERAKTELESTGDIGRIAWDCVVEELCKEVARLRSASKECGDAAKLREALVKIEKMAHCDLCNVYPKYRDKFNDKIGGIERIAHAALSAPPRNCDRFNTGDPMKDAEDSYDAWQRYCDNPTIPPSCKIESAFKYWLFAPTKEGGAK